MVRFLVLGAMIASWCYYALGVLRAWGSEVFGVPGSIHELFDFEAGPVPLPGLLIAFGLLVSLAMLASLALAYWSIWKILQAGPQQAFNHLGRRLNHLGIGLVGFWLFWNVLTGVFQAVLAQYATAATAAEYGWDPLDLDIVFPIIGSSVFLIGRMMDRAWKAEEENSQFL